MSNVFLFKAKYSEDLNKDRLINRTIQITE